jgi:hypothetical protein
MHHPLGLEAEVTVGLYYLGVGLGVEVKKPEYCEIATALDGCLPRTLHADLRHVLDSTPTLVTERSGKMQRQTNAERPVIVARYQSVTCVIQQFIIGFKVLQSPA